MRGFEGGRSRRLGTALGVTAVLGLLAVLAALPTARAASPPTSLALASKDPCVVGSGPLYPGFDPNTNEIYIPNAASGNITVLSASCKTLATISALPSGAYPYAAAFDPTDNLVYVTDLDLNQIYEISGTSIVRTVACSCDGPAALTYDPSLLTMGMVFTNYVSGTIGVINGTFLGRTAHVGSLPDAIVYDPHTSRLLVCNSGSDNVTVLDASSLGPVKTLSVGKDPSGIAFDPANAAVLIANQGSNNVSIFNGISVSTLRGFDHPSGMAWDQDTLEIYITNIGNGKVYAVNDTYAIVKKFSTMSDSDPYGIVYDPANQRMYVAGLDTNEVYVLS